MRSRRQAGSTSWPDGATAAVVAAMAGAVIAVWVAAWPGFPLMPALGLAGACLGGGAALLAFRPFDGGWWPLAAWLAVVLGTAGWLMTLAAPGWLPPGNLADLTHHLMLVDVLERTRHLVPNTPEAEAALGEMAHYTPGFHLLAVLIGAWTGAASLSVVYPLIVAMTALKFAVPFLIVRNVTGTGAVTSKTQQIWLPALAVGLLLYAPTPFTVGSFVRDGFMAQVAAELFAVAGWWAISAWSGQPRPAWLGLAGIFAAATFLTWPIWIGPLLLAGTAVVVAAPGVAATDRLKGLALMGGPTAVVGSMHLVGHWRSLGIAGANGWVPAFEPTWATWIAMALAVLGFALTARTTRLRPVTWFLAAIAVQSAALFVVATMKGNQSQYMAVKMIYLAVYPASVLAAVGAGYLLTAVAEQAAGPRMGVALSWVATAAVVAIAIHTLAAMPPPPIMVTEDRVRAGHWARDHLPPACVDYIVNDAQTAYWMHLAVLGQPRSSTRTADIGGYRANPAVGRWIERDGLPYAVADTALLPPEVRDTTTVLQRFGDAAIIERNNRGDRAACEDQEP